MTTTAAGRAEPKVGAAPDERGQEHQQRNATADVARVLHRIGFHASPGEVSRWAGPAVLVERLLDGSADSGSGQGRLAATMAAFWRYHLAAIPGAGEHMSRAPLGNVASLAPVIGEEHLVRVLAEHFVGSAPDAEGGAALWQVLRDHDFEVVPVLARIMRSDEFLSGRSRRLRLPYEWTFGALRAIGIVDPVAVGVDVDGLWRSAQSPSIEAGQIAQTSAVLGWAFPDKTLTGVRPEPGAVLGECGIYDPSERTLQMLTEATDRFADTDDLVQLLFALALTSPDFLMM